MSALPAVKVSMPAPFVVLPICTLAQADTALTVTVNPRSIITISPATGHEPTATAPPPLEADHVVFIAQLPELLSNKLPLE